MEREPMHQEALKIPLIVQVFNNSFLNCDLIACRKYRSLKFLFYVAIQLFRLHYVFEPEQRRFFYLTCFVQTP